MKFYHRQSFLEFTFVEFIFCDVVDWVAFL